MAARIIGGGSNGASDVLRYERRTSRTRPRLSVHPVIVDMSQDIRLLNCYGYTREGRRWFVGNPRTLEERIQIAEDALKDRRRGFVRAEVKDIRAGEVVWHSAPVLWPGGVR